MVSVCSLAAGLGGLAEQTGDGLACSLGPDNDDHSNSLGVQDGHRGVPGRQCNNSKQQQ